MAKDLGKKLLEKGLIACYNLTSVDSAYWWKGELEEGEEILMILKTKLENFDKIETFLKENSGYEVPEIVAVKPEQVNVPYSNWVEEETSDGKN